MEGSEVGSVIPVSSGDVISRAGITYRQLDYWISTGVVRPLVPAAGSGTRRWFRTEDIPRLRLLGRLRAQLGGLEAGQGGVNAEVARRIMREYRRGSMIFDGFALSWKVEDE